MISFAARGFLLWSMFLPLSSQARDIEDFKEMRLGRTHYTFKFLATGSHIVDVWYENYLENNDPNQKWIRERIMIKDARDLKALTGEKFGWIRNYTIRDNRRPQLEWLVPPAKLNSIPPKAEFDASEIKSKVLEIIKSRFVGYSPGLLPKFPSDFRIDYVGIGTHVHLNEWRSEDIGQVNVGDDKKLCIHGTGKEQQFWIYESGKRVDEGAYHWIGGCLALEGEVVTARSTILDPEIKWLDFLLPSAIEGSLLIGIIYDTEQSNRIYLESYQRMIRALADAAEAYAETGSHSFTFDQLVEKQSDTFLPKDFKQHMDIFVKVGRLKKGKKGFEQAELISRFNILIPVTDRDFSVTKSEETSKLQFTASGNLFGAPHRFKITVQDSSGRSSERNYFSNTLLQTHLPIHYGLVRDDRNQILLKGLKVESDRQAQDGGDGPCYYFPAPDSEDRYIACLPLSSMGEPYRLTGVMAR